MKTLTAEAFKALVAKNPAWASTLTEPTEVSDYCSLEGSKITHLSPHLHFPKSANFSYCLQLKRAEGTFGSYVSFQNSGVEEIGELKILAPNKDGYATSFFQAPHLKKATGIFTGFVSFAESAVEIIENLVVTNPNRYGDGLQARDCPNLHTVHAKIHGKTILTNCPKLTNLQITTTGPSPKLDLTNSPIAIPTTFHPKDVEAEPEKITELIARRNGIKALQKNLEPELEP